ncbi:MAG: glycogen/starch synthase [Flavobacteriales bacterium]|nr:glycogen/starch synthase [Flavobacteriales bacterium]
MSKTKVLFVSQEILPFSAESPNATSGRYLPQAVHEKGKETRIFMPRYGKINERRHQLHEVIRLSGMNLIVNDTDHPLIIKVASIPQIRIQVYFIDNEEYFHRKAYFTDESGTLFPDNDMRMIFFTKGVLETVKRLGWSPDIIHCHGWFTSLMPMYIKKLYRRDPYFAESKIVLSLYDDSFEGSLNTKLSDKIAFDGIDKKFMGNISNPSYVNLCKLGLEYSDAVILGSENVNSKVEQYASQLDVPLLRQYEEEDYLTAVDEFYDYAVLGKSVLVD